MHGRDLAGQGRSASMKNDRYWTFTRCVTNEKMDLPLQVVTKSQPTMVRIGRLDISDSTEED